MPELVDCDSSTDEVTDSESDDEDEPISGEDAGHEIDAAPVQPAGDFLTDDEDERASDHEDECIAWDQPKSWEQDKTSHPLIASLGDAKWTMPGERNSIPSQDTGPDQDPTFMVKVYMLVSCMFHLFYYFIMCVNAGFQ